MLIICRVYEDGQQHRELPAIVKSRVCCVLEDDGRYKNIPCSHRRYEQGQQHQTHQETSKPHITILVKIFSIVRAYIFSLKRETIHIKDDNKWERDNANLDRLRKIIKQLTHKNILRVDDWKKANQGCTEYNSRKNSQYLKINMEAIGPVDDVEVKRDFGKIFRRITESTAIDKKYMVV